MKYLFFMLSIFCFNHVFADYRQEKVEVVYWNPAYIKDAHVSTGRHGRDDSYYSNLTVTTLTTNGNNVSRLVHATGDPRAGANLAHRSAWQFRGNSASVLGTMPMNDHLDGAAVTLQLVSGGDFRLSNKLCNIMKEVWVLHFLEAHSDLDVTCPFPPRTYNLFNIVLPPKNMPVPMIASDYYVTLEIYLTSSNEQILKVLTTLRYEETKWKTK